MYALDVTPPVIGQTYRLELRSPAKSGFLISKIDGLEPPFADINTTPNITSGGSTYNSVRVQQRNIVLTLVHYPVAASKAISTVEQVRILAYKIFPVGKKISLLFYTEHREARIEGYVESHKTNLFSNREESIVSLICPDPYFYKKEETIVDFSGTTGTFMFPFKNDSLTQSLLQFGTISLNTEQSLYYEGDSPNGVTISIHAYGPASGLAIYNTTTNEAMLIDSAKLLAQTGSGIIAGDDIIVSTVRGKKTVYLFRGSAQHNIMNCLSRDAAWFQLGFGNNVFLYNAASGLTNLQFRMRYETLYEGI